MDAAPRVLIILDAQWQRALIRAALREVGYDAIGARSLHEAAIHRAIEAGRGPLRVIVADHDAIEDAVEQLQALLTAHHDARVMLLAHGTREPPPGPWARVVRRPISVADVVAEVEGLYPLPLEARHPIDVRDE